MANKENENKEISKGAGGEVLNKKDDESIVVEIIDFDDNGKEINSKNESDKEDSGKKDSNETESDKEDSRVEDSNKEGSNKEESGKEEPNKESSNNENSNKKDSNKEESNKVESKEEGSNVEDTNKEDSNHKNIEQEKNSDTIDIDKEGKEASSDNAEEKSNEDESSDDEEAKDDSGDEAKSKKKEKKWTAFDIGQIVVIVALLFVCLLGTYKLYQNLTAVRFTKALALAQNAQNNADYATAIKYYEQAISIDSKSAIAYEELANCYATLGDTEHVMSVLYSGWQNIGDQTMLDNYISLKLNGVIASIQTSGGSFDAIEDVLDVLKIDGNNENALQLLGTLYSYCMIDKNSSGDSVLFWGAGEEDSTFSQYLEAVSTMLDIYEVSPSDELEMLIARYIMPEGNVLWIGLDNCSDYALLVQDASTLIGESSSLDSFIGCLEDANEVSGVFARIWPKISEDDVDAFRDFMIRDDVILLRESLASGEHPYLELEMENAFCQEGIILTLEDNNWTYHFPDFSENPATDGVITLQLSYDEVSNAKAVIEEAKENGTLEELAKSSDETIEDTEEGSSEEEEIRSGKISMYYEPAVTGGKYFPHMTYYIVCEYEGDEVTYKYQQVITSEDGTKTRTTVDNWGDEELETVIDEDLEEETDSTETAAPTQTQPQDNSSNTESTPNVIVDPETGAMYDPNTGLQIDPATGFLIDPATGLYIDPNTWTYIDPATGAVVDPNAPAAEETPADTGAAAAGT